MSKQEQEHFLSNTPVDVAIKSLERQVDQLKKIVNKSDNVAPIENHNQDAEQELKEQIKALQIANDKAEYRIKILIRTLEEKK